MMKLMCHIQTISAACATRSMEWESWMSENNEPPPRSVSSSTHDARLPAPNSDCSDDVESHSQLTSEDIDVARCDLGGIINGGRTRSRSTLSTVIFVQNGTFALMRHFGENGSCSLRDVMP